MRRLGGHSAVCNGAFQSVLRIPMFKETTMRRFFSAALAALALLTGAAFVDGPSGLGAPGTTSPGLLSGNA